MNKIRHGFGGEFVLYPGTPFEQVLPNLVTNEGEESFLKMLFRADVADVSSGGNFYLGLCLNGPAETDELTNLTEPTTAGGYARQAVTRDASGWPTLDEVNGVKRIATGTITFSASGANFSTAINRVFLCNVASGTSGILFAYGGQFTNSITVQDGESLPVQYRFYLR